MITYRKKSLKVHTIHASTGCHLVSYDDYVRRLSRCLEEFIEKGEYSRIADIFFYGESANGETLTCSIIYEATA